MADRELTNTGISAVKVVKETFIGDFSLHNLGIMIGILAAMFVFSMLVIMIFGDPDSPKLKGPWDL